MKTLPAGKLILSAVMMTGLGFFSFSGEKAFSQQLSPDQLEELSAQLQAIRKVLTEQASDRNKSAADIFMAASASDKEALTLYVNCYKQVFFDDEGREESDFRDWRDRQSDRFRDDAFVEGLRVQLRYLALSCKAAEAEDLSEVFTSLLTYVDSLTQLSELPGNEVMQPVTNSVFARAYELNQQLSKNKQWEPIPYNIPGIYEKTILPYLRDEKPSQLDAAWAKRIEQETRVVQFLEREKEKQVKGSRDDRRQIRNRQSQQRQNGGEGANIMRSHDQEYFLKETLPALKWGRMVDSFKYGNSSKAGLEMLAFIKENYKSPRAQTWINQFATLLANAGGSSREAEKAPVPTPSAPTSKLPTSSVTPGAGSATAGGAVKGTTSTTIKGSVPPGLEPAN